MTRCAWTFRWRRRHRLRNPAGFERKLQLRPRTNSPARNPPTPSLFGAVAPFCSHERTANLAASGRPILRPLSRRQWTLVGAALAGAAPGALFATEIVQAATGLWSSYVVPAFFELLLSGIPFCA